jgi:hypothetical protein
MSPTITWSGTSGKKYDTELCQFDKPFYANPGVYIFCKPAANNTWAQIYIGETDDFNDHLNTNLKNHRQWSCIIRNGATNVCVIVVTGGKAARLTVETDLQTALDPPCNRQ